MIKFITTLGVLYFLLRIIGAFVDNRHDRPVIGYDPQLDSRQYGWGGGHDDDDD